MIDLAEIIVRLGAAKTRSAARDLIKAGAVCIDGIRVRTYNPSLDRRTLWGRSVRVGKKAFFLLTDHMAALVTA